MSESPVAEVPIKDVQPEKEIGLQASKNEKVVAALGKVDFSSPDIQEAVLKGDPHVTVIDGDESKRKVNNQKDLLWRAEAETPGVLADALIKKALEGVDIKDKPQLEALANRIKDSLGKSWQLQEAQIAVVDMEKWGRELSEKDRMLADKKTKGVDDYSAKWLRDEIILDQETVKVIARKVLHGTAGIAPELLAESGIAEKLTLATGQKLLPETETEIPPDNLYFKMLKAMAQRDLGIKPLTPAEMDSLKRDLTFQEPPPKGLFPDLKAEIGSAMPEISPEPAVPVKKIAETARNLINGQQIEPVRTSESIKILGSDELKRVADAVAAVSLSETSGITIANTNRANFDAVALNSKLPPTENLIKGVRGKFTSVEQQKALAGSAAAYLTELTTGEPPADALKSQEQNKKIEWLTLFLELFKMGFESTIVLGKVAREQERRRLQLQKN